MSSHRLFAWALLLPLVACTPTAGGLGGPRVDLVGAVVDTVASDAPVSEAWIVIDTGEELISARSSADGSFHIPDLPADVPIVVTFAAQDRVALTRTDMVLQDADLPLQVGLRLRNPDAYEREVATVSGVATGAPAGAWLLISGEGMSEYEYVPVEDDQPVPFEFEVERLAGSDEPLLFAALAFDGESGDILDATVGEGAWDTDIEADLQFVGEAPLDLTVRSPAPLLDGERLETLDDEYLSSLCLTALGEDWGAFVGWNESWEAEGDGFAMHARYVPVQGYPVRAAAYLVDDLTGGDAFSYVAMPLEPGATSLQLDPLDAPHLSSHGTFAPGASVSWDAAPAEARRSMTVAQGAQTAWWLTADADEIAFPRFPEGFDISLLLDGEATWSVRLSAYDEVDGAMDELGPYRVSQTQGGAASF